MLPRVLVTQCTVDVQCIINSIVVFVFVLFGNLGKAVVTQDHKHSQTRLLRPLR